MTDPVPLRPNQESIAVASLRCPNMLAVASGKGGVGKTWFSITFSHALARRGARVLLFDGDLGLANVDIQLGLTPEKDLGNVIEGQASLEEALTRQADGGFDILAGRSGSGRLSALPVNKVSELREGLLAIAPKYDHVLVDLGAGVDRSVRQMAGPAAMTYVIVTDEPTSMTDAYAYIKLTHAANPKADLRIVVNMANTAAEGQKTYEALNKVCKSFLRISPPLAGIIRRDPKVRDAIRAQMPLLTRSPISDAADDVMAIASAFLNTR